MSDNTITVYRVYDYAHHKSLAMGYRHSGYIEDAVRQEARCEVLYKELPEWARWYASVLVPHQGIGNQTTEDTI